MILLTKDEIIRIHTRLIDRTGDIYINRLRRSIRIFGFSRLISQNLCPCFRNLRALRQQAGRLASHEAYA